MFIKSIFFSFLLLVLIYIQYKYIYFYLTKFNHNTYQNIQISIQPFNAWNRISRNIIFSSITWFALPFGILVLYGKKLLKERIYIYAIMGFIIGLFLFICFEEVLPSGKPYGSVNFLWQLIITFYIWSVVSIALISKYIYQRNYFIWKDKILLGIFLYYSLGGLLYLFNTVFNKLL